MSRVRLLFSLICINLAVFIGTAAFLPRPNSFAWSTGNPISYIINSRDRWDIAWLALLASSLASVSVYLLASRNNRGQGET